MRQILYIAAILLAGCDGSTPGSNDAAAVAAAEPPKAAQAPAPDAKDVSIDEKSDLLEWHLGYPAMVGTIAKLEALIRGPALAKKAEFLKSAREDKAERDTEGYPFNAYEASVDYSIAGNSPRLLSLSADWFTFTGGAHPNHGTLGLLWDKAAGREMKVSDLFTGGATTLHSLFGSAYCKALDKQRADKRGGELDGGLDDPFNACPKFSELNIIPIAKGDSGRLNAIQFHADPYTAGPYSEGDYDVELPMAVAAIAALKPEYRSSFAAN